MTIGREEPECLKKWKLEQDEMLKKKDANEELRKEELRAKAAQELADWHKQYEEQLEKKKSPVKINQIISPACEKKCSMSDQRRVSYRKLTVLARRNLEEKAEKEAVKENDKKSVPASKFEEEDTVFIDIPEPCVDVRGVVVFGDKYRRHSISVNRVNCGDPNNLTPQHKPKSTMTDSTSSEPPPVKQLMKVAEAINSSEEDSSDTEAAEYDEKIKSLERKQELADTQIQDLERKIVEHGEKEKESVAKIERLLGTIDELKIMYENRIEELEEQ